MSIGDYIVRKNSTNTDEVPATGSDLLLDWPTAEANVGSGITHSNGIITLGETGHFLVICSEHYRVADNTNNERINAKMTFTLAGVELVEGYSTGYLRKNNTALLDYINHSAAIINVTTTTGNGDELEVRLERIDDVVITGPVRVVDDLSSITIIKLDDSWDYGRYQSSAPRATSGTDNTRVVMNLQTQDEQDTSFIRTTDTIEIDAVDDLVLAVYSVKSEGNSSNRQEFQSNLFLGGSAVDGSWNQVYIRNNENSIWGGSSNVVLLNPTAGQNLDLGIVTRELGGTITFDVALQLVRLPAGTEAIILESAAGNYNPTAATNFNWPNASAYEDTAAFTFSSGQTNIDVDNAGDYIVMAGLCDATDAGSAVARAMPKIQFRVNTTDVELFGHSTYSRNSGTADHSALSTAGLLTGLSTNDSIHVRNERLGPDVGTITNTTGQFAVLRLSSLFVNPDVSVPITTVASAAEVGTVVPSGGDVGPTIFTFTFDALDDGDNESFVYTGPQAGTTVVASNTAGRWCHEVNETVSVGVGPWHGEATQPGGGDDGYIYTEMSSQVSGDVWTMEWDTTMDADANDWDFNFWWCARGNNAQPLIEVETNENAAGWVVRLTTGDVDNTTRAGGDETIPATSATEGANTPWFNKSIDLTGLISHASTRIRIRIQADTETDTAEFWHNDIGFDTIVITQTPKDSGETAALTTVASPTQVGTVSVGNRNIAITGEASPTAVQTVGNTNVVDLSGILSATAVESVVASNDGSAILSGVTSAAVVGAVGFTEAGSVGLTGVASATQVEGLTTTNVVDVTGISSSPQVEALTVTNVVDITSVVSSTQVETVGNVTAVDLSGISSATEVDTMSASISASAALTGVTSATAVGSVSFTESGSVDLTGVTSSTAVEGLSTTNVVDITGITSATAIGNVDTNNLVSITSVFSVTAVEGLSTTNVVDVTGITSATAIGTVVASNDGSAVLTGVSSAAVVGNISASSEGGATLTGVTTAAVVGTVGKTNDGELALTGITSAAATGNVDTNNLVNITSVFSSSVVGTVGITISGSVTITGITSVTAVETVGNTSVVNVTGVTSTTAIETISFTESGTIVLTGVTSVTEVGNISASSAGGATLSGISSSALVGTVGITNVVDVTGVVSSTFVGTLIYSSSIPLIGISSSTLINNIVYTSSISLTGVVSVTAIDTLIYSSSILLTGVQSITETQAVSTSADYVPGIVRIWSLRPHSLTWDLRSENKIWNISK